MSRHYSLLKEENERILWSASKMVSLPEMSISKIICYAMHLSRILLKGNISTKPLNRVSRVKL